MEGFRLHTVDGRLFGCFLSIIVCVDDGFILVLPVDEVEVVLAVGVELDGSVSHKLIIAYIITVCICECYISLILCKRAGPCLR